MKTPQRKICMADIAREVGVSPASVARVLVGTGKGKIRVSDATAKKISDAAKKLGYRPNRFAQTLAGKKSRLLGILIDSHAPLINNQRMITIMEKAEQQGYQFIVGYLNKGQESMRKCIEMFLELQLEGVVCLAHDYPGYREPIADLLSVLPTVVFYGQPRIENAACVRVDTAKGIDLAVDHLLKTGRKRIGLALETIRAVPMRERLRGYHYAMKKHGITIDSKQVWIGPAAKEEVDEKVIPVILDHLLNKANCDAILASNDIYAIHLIRECARRGLSVPEDISIVGFDNIPMARWIDPALTTLDQNAEETANALVDLLLKRVENNTSGEEEIVISPRLIVRASA